MWRRVAGSERIARCAVVFCVIGFVALILPAMRDYPGGTVWDRTTRGSDFWFNYLSDLQRSVALNGAPNVEGSRFAQAATLVLALGLASTWWLAARLFPERPRLGRAVRVFGLVSVLGAIAAGLMPSDRFAGGHQLSVVLGGASGLVATGLAVVGMARGWRSEWLLLTALGTATLLVSGVDFFLYVQHFGLAGPPSPAGALLERVSTLLLLPWMCAIALHGARRGRRS
jgi:hypothetical protein